MGRCGCMPGVQVCAPVCEYRDTCVCMHVWGRCVYLRAESLATYDWHASANDMQMQVESEQIPSPAHPPRPGRWPSRRMSSQAQLALALALPTIPLS